MLQSGRRFDMQNGGPSEYEEEQANARLQWCRLPVTYSQSAAGINRADGVEKREASENVERSVSPRLEPSPWCEPDRFSDSGAILALNSRVDPFPRLLFVGRSEHRKFPFLFLPESWI
jgi:hypothetical protein